MSQSLPEHQHANPYASSPVDQSDCGRPATPDGRINFWKSKRELLRTIWIVRAAALFWGLWSLRQLVEIVVKVFIPHPPLTLSVQIGFLAQPDVLIWFVGNLVWLGLNLMTAWLDWLTAERIRRFAAGVDKDPIIACQLFRRAWIFNLAAFGVYLALEAFNFIWRALTVLQ